MTWVRVLIRTCLTADALILRSLEEHQMLSTLRVPLPAVEKSVSR